MKTSEIISTEINYEGIDLKVDYVFEGLDHELRILLINNAPDFFFSAEVVDQVESLLSEQLINEALERREYIHEQHGDESRGN
jgi:hypothetical protein